MTRALQVTLFFVAFKATLATLVNRTIDDTIGDLRTGKGVSYSPAGAWTGPGQCPACWIQPDATLAHNGTFMETSYLPGTELAERVPEVSLSLEFRGTAIYVFFTYANDIGRSGATTRTECDIVLDNGSPVNIQREPDMSITELSYQQLFWHRTGLEDKDHTLVIHGRGPRRSYINFDYALYTQDDPSILTLPSSSPAPVGAIVGGTVGGLIAIAFGVFLFLYVSRRRKRRSRTLLRTSTELAARPYPVSPDKQSFSLAETSTVHSASTLVYDQKSKEIIKLSPIGSGSSTIRMGSIMNAPYGISRTPLTSTANIIIEEPEPMPSSPFATGRVPERSDSLGRQPTATTPGPNAQSPSGSSPQTSGLPRPTRAPTAEEQASLRAELRAMQHQLVLLEQSRAERPVDEPLPGYSPPT